VIKGTPRENVTHPTTALLIVEVSETTLSYDRAINGPLYAAAGIVDYWIVNLLEKCVEVYRQPAPDGATPGAFRYSMLTVHKAGELITPLSSQGAAIAVADLLP